jgi:hypothetical protein
MLSSCAVHAAARARSATFRNGRARFSSMVAKLRNHSCPGRDALSVATSRVAHGGNVMSSEMTALAASPNRHVLNFLLSANGC